MSHCRTVLSRTDYRVNIARREPGDSDASMDEHHFRVSDVLERDSHGAHDTAVDRHHDVCVLAADVNIHDVISVGGRWRDALQLSVGGSATRVGIFCISSQLLDCKSEVLVRKKGNLT